MTEDIYQRLEDHLFTLGQEYTPKEGLEEILRENFTPLEAEVALALPAKVMPLQPVGVDAIIDKVNLPRKELVDILERLSGRGLLFSGKTKEGQKGYALVQRGFGFPQTFFWKGEETPFAKNMAELVDKYNRGKKLEQTYPTSKTPSFQFIPIGEAIEPEMQAIYSYTMLEKVIDQAAVIAVAHCPCRFRARLLERGCDHLLEVCLKFDEMAEYMIERELAREVTKEEALEIIRKSEEDGLVHFVDNALGDIKHNCNCCGCCCWALSPIKNRRVPRDVIMATYFIRKTDEGECVACGNCVEVCPVDAITMGDNYSIVDEIWCVGCGLCVAQCLNSAAKLEPRSDVSPPPSFKQLHERILVEKGFAQCQPDVPI
jgi:NAD-dependent dihydropyrimidine dehydrogenase PreA subunit